MKMNKKTTKIIAIVFVVLVALAIITYSIKKYNEKKASDNVSSNSGNSSTSNYKYSAPGTPLTQTAKPDEWAEMKDRYAGMNRTAIISDYAHFRFDNDQGYLDFLQQKANENGISLEQQKLGDAEYLLKKAGVIS